MAHRNRKATSKDRDGAASQAIPRKSLGAKLLRLLPKVETSPGSVAKKIPPLEPYGDFDLLMTVGHNIG